MEDQLPEDMILLVVGEQEDEGEGEGDEPDVPAVVVALGGPHAPIDDLQKYDSG